MSKTAVVAAVEAAREHLGRASQLMPNRGTNTPTRVAVVDRRAALRGEWARALASNSAVEVALVTWCLDDAVSLRQAPDVVVLGSCSGADPDCPARRRLERLGCRVISAAADVTERRAATRPGAVPTPGCDQGEGQVAIQTLSRQERRVLELYSAGLTLADVAATMHLTENTVATYLKRVRAKLRASGLTIESKMQLRDRAIAHGLLSDT